MHPRHWIIPLTLWLGALASTTIAQTDAKSGAEAQFFHAYYQETALRDFAAAAANYKQAAESASATEKPLAARACVGAARCLLRLDRQDEAKTLLAQASAFDPKNAELGALQKSLDGGASISQEQRIENLLRLANTPVPASHEAVRDLLGLGATGEEAILAYLRKQPIDATPWLLNGLGNHADKAMPVVTKALSDPQVQCGGSILRAIERTPVGLPLLGAIEAALTNHEKSARREAATRLINIATACRSAALADRFVALVESAQDRGGAEVLQSLWKFMNPVPPNLVAPLTNGLSRRLATDPSAATAAGLYGNRHSILGSLAATEVPPETMDRLAGVLREAGLTLCQRAVPLERVTGAILLNQPCVQADATTREATFRVLADWATGALPHQDEANQLPECIEPIKSSPRLSPDQELELFRLVGLDQCPLPTGQRNHVRRAVASSIRARKSAADLEAWIATGRRGLEVIADSAGLFEWISLCTHRGVDAFDLYWRHAESKSSEVRMAAYQALLSTKTTLPEPLPAEMPSALLTDFTDPGMRVPLSLFGRFRWKAATPALLSFAKKSKADEERRSALDLIAELDGKAAASVLLALAGESHLSPQDLAAPLYRALGEECLESWRTLAGELGAAAGVLSSNSRRFGDRRLEIAPEFYGKFLASLDPALIDEATVVEAAQVTAKPDWHRWLHRMLDSEAPDGTLVAVIRTVVAERLYEAAPKLVRALDHPRAMVRDAAQDALITIRTQEDLRAHFGIEAEAKRASLEKARAWMKDQDPEKRRVGVLTLGALRELSALPLVLEAAEDPAESVRAAAVSVLASWNAAR